MISWTICPRLGYDFTVIIDGVSLSRRILARLMRRAPPREELAAVLVGEDESSRSFLARKAAVARELGVRFRLYEFPSGIAEARLIRAVSALSLSARVGGVIIQLPLPARFARQRVLDAVSPMKDVDCLTEAQLGKLAAGTAEIFPPAVGTVEELLRAFRFPAQGARAAVIGAGSLVGKPLSLWLWFQRQIADLTIFRSGARTLRRRLRDYDLIVSGAGHAGLFAPRDLKPGAVVIDFGYAHRLGRMCGDFTPPRTAAEEQRVRYTPVPGGAGPVLVAKLFENFYALSALRRG